jgi:hypothetical protein
MVNVIKEITNVYKTVNKVPGVIADLSDGQLQTLADFAKEPRNFILGVLSLWVVEQVFAFTRVIVAQILRVFELLASIPALLMSPLTAAFGVFGDTILPVRRAGRGGRVGGAAGRRRPVPGRPRGSR